MYIFAGFAGVLAVLLAVLVIRHWSSGNRSLLLAICGFMVSTLFLDALYFCFDYIELVDHVRTSNTVLRVLDISLFIAQIYFWTMYMRKKSGKPAKETIRHAMLTGVSLTGCLVLAVLSYGHFMNGYYEAESEYSKILAIIIEYVLMIVLTGVNAVNCMEYLPSIEKKKTKRCVVLITVFLSVNGVWNAILLIFILMGNLGLLIENAFDPTSLFIFAINILTMVLITGEDFSIVFKPGDGSDEDAAEEQSLESKLDRTAELHKLTAREREILELAYERMTYPEIAEKLCISKYTVKNHLHNIFEKLEISTRTELIEKVDHEK